SINERRAEYILPFHFQLFAKYCYSGLSAVDSLANGTSSGAFPKYLSSSKRDSSVARSPPAIFNLSIKDIANFSSSVCSLTNHCAKFQVAQSFSSIDWFTNP